MIFFMSCRTTRTVEKIVYYVPIVDFPEFPELGGYEKIDGGKIATDENYFRKLLTFRTSYFDALEKYNDKINYVKEKK